MSKSTANYIAYDLRPVKQTERRLILDILRLSKESDIDPALCSYIGMGGIKFYDFEMMHRYLGIRPMISLEQDKDIIERCHFNRPFGFISVKNQVSSDFIDEYSFKDPAIVWFDYDWALSKTVTSDVSALATKLKTGSFVFFTVKGEMAPRIAELSPEERAQHFRDELGDLSLDCKVEDIEPDRFPAYVGQVIGAALTKAFAGRRDGSYRHLMKILYRDSCWMLTIGGCFCSEESGARIQSRLKESFPFLYEGTGGVFQLDDLLFTSKERVLLDRFVTSEPANEDDKLLMKKLKFSNKKLKAYRSVVRFLPRYVESFL